MSSLARKAFDLSAEALFVPILFIVAILNFLPNPLRYILAKSIEGSSAAFMKPAIGTGGRRIMLAVDDTSHEAVKWAILNMLDPNKDYVSLVYVPEGDFKQVYGASTRFTNYDWADVLPSVDFLWEYCQELDMAKVRL